MHLVFQCVCAHCMACTGRSGRADAHLYACMQRRPRAGHSYSHPLLTWQALAELAAAAARAARLPRTAHSEQCDINPTKKSARPSVERCSHLGRTGLPWCHFSFFLRPAHRPPWSPQCDPSLSQIFSILELLLAPHHRSGLRGAACRLSVSKPVSSAVSAAVGGGRGQWHWRRLPPVSEGGLRWDGTD